MAHVGNSIMSYVRPYLHPKVLIVLLLGFSSGLPRLLVASTLGAWLGDSGVDKATVGLFAYVALPYSFNFIWAPLIDHLKLPVLTRWLGRRRGWLLLSQVFLLITIAVLAQIDPALYPLAIAGCALLVAFFSASQDIVIDAFRTEYLDKEQYNEGAAVAIFGYRLGMLVAGAGALIMADMPTIAWPGAYMLMAVCMLVGIITTLSMSEPDVVRKEVKQSTVEGWMKEALIEPFHQFILAHSKWWLLLTFVVLYRMSDGFLGFMSTPFMIDIGFSKTEIATIAKVYGLGATIIGAFVGGAMLHRLGLLKSLWIFAGFQLVANLTYIVLAYVGPETWGLALAIACDNLAGGMATTAGIALIMRLCHTDYTATQYALLASLSSLGSILLAGGAGWIAKHYGWMEMFMTSATLGLPALWLIYLLRAELAALDNPES